MKAVAVTEAAGIRDTSADTDTAVAAAGAVMAGLTKIG